MTERNKMTMKGLYGPCDPETESPEQQIQWYQQELMRKNQELSRHRAEEVTQEEPAASKVLIGTKGDIIKEQGKRLKQAQEDLVRANASLKAYKYEEHTLKKLVNAKEATIEKLKQERDNLARQLEECKCEQNEVNKLREALRRESELRRHHERRATGDNKDVLAAIKEIQELIKGPEKLNYVPADVQILEAINASEKNLKTRIGNYQGAVEHYTKCAEKALREAEKIPGIESRELSNFEWLERLEKHVKGNHSARIETLETSLQHFSNQLEKLEAEKGLPQDPGAVQDLFKKHDEVISMIMGLLDRVTVLEREVQSTHLNGRLTSLENQVGPPRPTTPMATALKSHTIEERLGHLEEDTAEESYVNVIDKQVGELRTAVNTILDYLSCQHCAWAEQYKVES